MSRNPPKQVLEGVAAGNDATYKGVAPQADTILQIMQDYGEMLMDGYDEDDNVINLCVGFARIDALDALKYTTPELATLILLTTGALVAIRRRRRLR